VRQESDFISFRAPPYMRAALLAAARARDVSRARVIKDALAAYLGVEPPHDRRTIQGREAGR
jgi:hypothetical protein